MIHCPLPRVLDVLGLLPVSQWLLQSLDDQTSGIGLNVHFGLSVLNRQLHSDSDALPGNKPRCLARNLACVFKASCTATEHHCDRVT